MVEAAVYPYVKNYLMHVGHETQWHLASLNINAVGEELRKRRSDLLGLTTVMVPYMIIHHGFHMQTHPDLLMLSSVRVLVRRVLAGQQKEFSTPVALMKVGARLYLMIYEWCLPTQMLGEMSKTGHYPELTDENALIKLVRQEIIKVSDRLRGDRRRDIRQVQSFQELKDTLLQLPVPRIIHQQKTIIQ